MLERERDTMTVSIVHGVHGREPSLFFLMEHDFSREINSDLERERRQWARAHRAGVHGGAVPRATPTRHHPHPPPPAPSPCPASA